ncbi:MAG TPA: exodeoxyribonuclease VII large subunit [Vicinamibacterales bacterium]|nr:exodeoxyribonuclease VII large subunit [Vicinamibacterales bacterium]
MRDLFDTPFEEAPEPEKAREAHPKPRRRVVSVSELTAEIRGLLEGQLGEVWVEGEISNCRVWNTGHMYFTLKDGTAQIRAVMFRMAVRNLRFTADDGLHVVARGRLGVYEPKGEYQLVCEHMEPHGLGALQLAFDQLKKRLHAEGLFDPSRKRPLPALPRKIGIVTSLDGAALRDIIKVLRRRHPNAHLVIRPSRVQGEGAAAEITRAIRAIGKVPGVDVVIAGRGGGSIEDLWAFNEEAVARAIADCPVPVISAVGHEVDVTIADFVADLRAPTPSAAAELVVAAKDEFSQRIDRLGHRLQAAARSSVQRRQGLLHSLTARRGLGGWPTRVAMHGRHAAELTHGLRRAMLARVARQDREYRGLRERLEAHDLRRRMAGIRGRLEAVDGRLGAAAIRSRERIDGRFRVLAGRLENLSPLAVLARGYAVCWNGDRTVIIRRATAVNPGDRVRVTLHEGEIDCEVRGRSNDGIND